METIIWLIAITFGIAISCIAMKSLNKGQKVKQKYDERQLLVRGDAYKYGFLATLITNGVLMTLSVDGQTEFLGVSAFFLPIFVGIVAQITYSIFKDAYIGLNDNTKNYLIFMAFVGILNLAIAIIATINGELIENGVLAYSFLNYLCGGLFIILGLELFIKSRLDKKA
jgi:hypothetical protein